MVYAVHPSCLETLFGVSYLVIVQTLFGVSYFVIVYYILTLVLINVVWRLLHQYKALLTLAETLSDFVRLGLFGVFVLFHFLDKLPNKMETRVCLNLSCRDLTLEGNANIRASFSKRLLI